MGTSTYHFTIFLFTPTYAAVTTETSGRALSVTRVCFKAT